MKLEKHAVSGKMTEKIMNCWCQKGASKWSNVIIIHDCRSNVIFLYLTSQSSPREGLGM